MKIFNQSPIDPDRFLIAIVIARKIFQAGFDEKIALVYPLCCAQRICEGDPLSPPKGEAACGGRPP